MKIDIEQPISINNSIIYENKSLGSYFNEISSTNTTTFNDEMNQNNINNQYNYTSVCDNLNKLNSNLKCPNNHELNKVSSIEVTNLIGITIKCDKCNKNITRLCKKYPN